MDTLAPQDARDDLPIKAETVLAAAERAFLARGFGAVSMDAIARDAAVSKATVYAHFASKEELFGAVIARVSGRRFGGFSVEELDPQDVDASLLTIAERFLALVLSPEAIAVNRIVVAEVTRFPVLGEVFWRTGPERTRAQLEAFLRRADQAGSLAAPDARLAAEQFISLVRGDIHLSRLLQPSVTGEPDDLATAARAAVTTFLRAFRPGRPIARP